MTNGSWPQQNDFSSQSHFFQASVGHVKLPLQYGTSEMMPDNKSPKGCYLSGEHVVYSVDDWLPVQVHSELVLFPSKLFHNQDTPLKIGTQISANKQYIGYCIQSGTICVYNRQSRQQCLLQGHQQRVTDMVFCGEQVGLLASASSDGHVFIWSISETSGKEDDQIIRGQILLSLQVLGEWESVHPLVCWRNQDLLVGIDKYVLALTPEELKKNIESHSFAVDNPMKCHVGNLIRGIRFAGVHDLEVTALTVISRCPTLIASASRDGTVRIWRDQDPVPVTRFAPYEGLPVDSVLCLSPFENDLHVILTSGGPENSELKLWVPFDAACLVPASAIGKWKCVETVELRNSIDRKPCQLYFNQTLRDSDASLLVVGSTQGNSIYVVHVELEAHSAYMDYLSKFCVELPISNMTARSDSSSDGEGIVEIFCVHEESVQLYTLHKSQCIPPAHNGSSGASSPTGCYGHPKELDLLDPSSFYSADSDNYCTPSGKAEPLSPVSRSSQSVSGPPTSSGFGSWIEVPSLLDHLRDVKSAQTTDFVSQEQNNTGLMQINSIVASSFGQQETVTDSSSKEFWKGTKFSPVGSLGKLPETMAVTNFPTCTVPNLSVGHKSLEMLTSNDKWNGRVCRPTDFRGCSHGDSYVLNEVSPIVDNMNIYATDSILSSVMDQNVTGKINTTLSSDFSNKKTRTVKTQKLQEMGQRSELDNWHVSSEMLLFGNTVTSQQAREEIVCSKPITDTMTIEFAEGSDWKHIHEISISGSLSLNNVLRRGADDRNIDPSQIHGMEIVSNTAVGDITFLGGQIRRPVNLNPLQKLDVCTSSVQASLCTLSSMHAEFQKHISVVVEGLMREERNRLESCIAEDLETCLETYSDEMHSGFEEISTRDTEHNSMQHIALSISKDNSPSSVFENICKEISSLGPPIAKEIPSHYDRIKMAVVRNVSQKQEIIIDRLDKSIASATTELIIRQLQANFWSQTLQENIGPLFQEKTIPSFENLFRKVIERGETIIQENKCRHDSHVQQDLASYLISVASTLKETLNYATMELRSMTEELRQGQKRLSDLMHGDADYGLKNIGTDNSNKEVNDHDGAFHIGYFSRLVAEGKLEEAFQGVLSLGDVNAVLWLCNQVDPSKIFARNPLPVSQLVLLFLMQQLACDLGNEMAQKLLWIQEAATAMDPNDPTVSYYIRPALEQVYLNLERQPMQISLASTVVKKIKVIMHVINSLLTSCR